MIFVCARLISVANKVFLEHKIFLIDPKNIVLSGGIDSLNRHAIYSNTIKNVETPGRSNEFKVICPYDKKYEEIIQEYSFLMFPNKYKSRRISNFLYSVFKLIKHEKSDSILLIAGDPWQAAIYCLIIRCLVNKNIKIQIQVHADIGDNSWRKYSLKNKLKFYVSKYTLRKADTIRCVSITQLNKIGKNLKINEKKLFCSGIIYNIPPLQTIRRKKFKVPTVGFIGRIEPDRGIWEFVEIIKKLNSLGLRINVKIAGSGKFQKQFVSTLNKINSGEVDYLGQLSNPKIFIFWEMIDLCIFTAPTESFGRSMRESLANKVPIWAFKSSGFQDLSTKFKSDEVMEISTSESPEDLGKKLTKSLNIKIDYNYARYFIDQQEADLNNLIESWM